MDESILADNIRDGDLGHGNGGFDLGDTDAGQADNAEGLREHGAIIDDYVGIIEGMSWTPTEVYYSDVVACRDADEAAGICESIVRLARLHSKNDVVYISLHDDHIHIVHSCPYSNRSCRCAWLQGPEIQSFLRRKVRVRNKCAALRGDDWRDSLFYFSTEGRRLVFIKLRGKLKLIEYVNLGGV